MSEEQPIARIRMKSGSYQRIAAKVFNTPLLIEQSKLNTILHVLGPRMDFEGPEAEAAVYEGRRSDAGYQVTSTGIAIIPVMGTLIQRHDLFSSMSGFMSYGQIEKMLSSALEDESVETIIMELDSPGGEVAGCFDLSDFIYNSRGKKPMIGMVNELCASACYAIGSACDELVIPRTGYAGSIGVVTAHMDVSGAMEQQGVAVTYIYAGDHKIDGNPYNPLPKDVKADIQGDINQMYDMFTELVARNRGMDVKDVVATQAQMFMGREAVSIGLCDRVNILQNELSNSALRRDDRTRPTTQTEERIMSDKTTTPPAGNAVAITEDQVNAARAEGHAAGRAEGSAAERARIQGIFSCEHAEGRQAVASSFAFETDMTVEQATKSLAKVPASKPEASNQSALDRHMETAGTPDVGSLNPDHSPENDEVALAASIAAYAN